ncbi:hypothetical protein [Ruegeria arenilitoris]|uniref:hypothetical protein n=1 Tax=Ruegeria arenilitoris TaxID=1173585 RepID=UPI001480760E|nr:hypothetical protein [Ruegeria arenilitoris]
MPERPSRASAFCVLRTLDGQPVTGLIGISEAATEGREKEGSNESKRFNAIFAKNVSPAFPGTRSRLENNYLSY